MFPENAQSPLHQLIIIRFVTGRPLQLGNPTRLSECNPYLRYKYSFKVQANDIHVTSPPEICQLSVYSAPRILNDFTPSIASI